MIGGLLSFGGLAVGIIAIIAGVIILVWPKDNCLHCWHILYHRRPNYNNSGSAMTLWVIILEVSIDFEGSLKHYLRGLPKALSKGIE